MRPIKFRAWNKTRKEWDCFTLNNISVYLKELQSHLLGGDEFYLFTGLYDKKHEEIWEGDIIKLNPKIKYYRQIVFIGGNYWLINPDRKFDVEIQCIFSSHPEANIVGNIYENPELLTMSEHGLDGKKNKIIEWKGGKNETNNY